MKRIIASAGLAALGAASLQAAYTPGLTPMEQSKPWSIGLAVRGFYDDNYATAYSGSPNKRDSFGVSVSPTAAVNVALDQTLIGFNYTYDMRWYEDRPQNKADHIQLANLKLSHAFSERYKLDVSDRFIYAQEGTIYFDTGPITAPRIAMTDNDYVRNIGRVGFKAGVTEKLNIDVGYKNEIYDYEQAGFDSRSALLDRMEHLATLDFSVQLLPTTAGIIGYQYGQVDHRNKDGINSWLYEQVVIPDDGTGYLQVTDPTVRDQRSHYIYVGADHNFNPQLNGVVRVGAQFTEYVNAKGLYALEPSGSFNKVDDSSIIPYADARLTWTYNPGSFLMVGVVNTLNQTDVGQTLAQQSVAVYANVNHRITPRWTANLMGLFQNSTYQQGYWDGKTDMLWLAGVNLNYQFNPYLSAEVGYNYDRLDSDIEVPYQRSYDRNRVYIGLRATY